MSPEQFFNLGTMNPLCNCLVCAFHPLWAFQRAEAYSHFSAPSDLEIGGDRKWQRIEILQVGKICKWGKGGGVVCQICWLVVKPVIQ